MCLYKMKKIILTLVFSIMLSSCSLNQIAYDAGVISGRIANTINGQKK